MIKKFKSLPPDRKYAWVIAVVSVALLVIGKILEF
jgi:hypothetical protein